MTIPPDFTYPERKVDTARLAAQVIAALAADHRGAVQAGGCIGLWPMALAAHFDRVVTCEPAPGNFAALTANIAGVPAITAHACALGAEDGTTGLSRPKPNAGLWRLDGTGDIPVRRIDDLVGDQPIDALVLDVEGSEVLALRGAERTIAQTHPLIWVECTQHAAAITAWLTAHGYPRLLHGLGGDCYSVHASRVAH